MKHAFVSVAALLAALPLVVCAQDAEPASGWSGTGELGFAMSRGNAKSDNLNGRLAFTNEDDEWKHDFFLATLRNKSEVLADVDGDGVPEKSMQLSANRYELGASSARKLSETNSVVGSLRYENDDFAPYSHQTTVAIGYGHTFIKNDRTTLITEVGPGYRRAKDAATGETEGEVIARGKLDFKHQLTDSTTLFNTFLMEAGSDNTFASNEFGIAVAINSRMAMKFGFDARHNTDVAPGIKKTDTLTKVNLVYNFK